MLAIILQTAILRSEGDPSVLAVAVGSDWKGKLSPVVYLAAIACAFVAPAVSGGLYALVACLWLVPDRRIERVLASPAGE